MQTVKAVLHGNSCSIIIIIVIITKFGANIINCSSKALE